MTDQPGEFSKEFLAELSVNPYPLHINEMSLDERWIEHKILEARIMLLLEAAQSGEKVAPEDFFRLLTRITQVWGMEAVDE